MWRSLDEVRRRPIYLERNVITSTDTNPNHDTGSE
jgi:hypothetical protein